MCVRKGGREIDSMRESQKSIKKDVFSILLNPGVDSGIFTV